mmetsp:Transcript_17337/g.25682  ORF Transcript_17337/g.25682 Transcript_17337/m.25682 type:complete len:195 (+) Transcript_17337:3-587(+)
MAKVNFPRKRYRSKSTEDPEVADRRKVARAFRRKQMYWNRIYKKPARQEYCRASLQTLTQKRKEEEQAKPRHVCKYHLPEGKSVEDLVPLPRTVRPKQHVSERRVAPTQVPEDLVVPSEAKASLRTEKARTRGTVLPSEGGTPVPVGEDVAKEFLEEEQRLQRKKQHNDRAWLSGLSEDEEDTEDDLGLTPIGE